MKNISALMEDLKAVGKQLYFWNFSQDPFHVMARYNSENAKLFKTAGTLNEVLGNFGGSGDGTQLINGKFRL